MEYSMSYLYFLSKRLTSIYTEKIQVTSGIFHDVHEPALHNHLFYFIPCWHRKYNGQRNQCTMHARMQRTMGRLGVIFDTAVEYSSGFLACFDCLSFLWHGTDEMFSYVAGIKLNPTCALIG